MKNISLSLVVLLMAFSVQADTQKLPEAAQVGGNFLWHFVSAAEPLDFEEAELDLVHDDLDDVRKEVKKVVSSKNLQVDLHIVFWKAVAQDKDHFRYYYRFYDDKKSAQVFVELEIRHPRGQKPVIKGMRHVPEDEMFNMITRPIPVPNPN